MRRLLYIMTRASEADSTGSYLIGSVFNPLAISETLFGLADDPGITLRIRM